MTTALASITSQHGMTCDARTLVALLKASGAAMAVGLRDIVDLGDGIHARVGIKGQSKLVVKLNHRDLFDVELGHTVTRGARRFAWDVDAQALDVDAENLAATVIRLAEGTLR